MKKKELNCIRISISKLIRRSSLSSKAFFIRVGEIKIEEALNQDQSNDSINLISVKLKLKSKRNKTVNLELLKMYMR